MKVKVISILEDNYMYLVIEEQSKQAIAVDPAVPHRVRHIHALITSWALGCFFFSFQVTKYKTLLRISRKGVRLKQKTKTK